MKLAIRCALVAMAGVIALMGIGSRGSGGVAIAQEAVKTIPDVIILAKDAKLGQVAFSHASHNNGKYSVSGTGPIACVECHHTAQPASELAKKPPLLTSWPKDRTTTLTADLFTKDPTAAGVAACRDCHAKAGTTPKLLPEIPKFKPEGSTTVIEMNNQQAFHRNCTGCHAEAKKAKPDFKGPTAAQCTVCHKKAA